MTLKHCEIGISSGGQESHVDDDTSYRDLVNGTKVSKASEEVLDKPGVLKWAWHFY